MVVLKLCPQNPMVGFVAEGLTTGLGWGGEDVWVNLHRTEENFSKSEVMGAHF